MKHILTIILCLLGIAQAKSFDYALNGLYYFIPDENVKEATVTFFSTNAEKQEGAFSGNIVIPEAIELNGEMYQVTIIGNKAFANATGITSVSLSHNIREIGIEAFSNNRGLEEIFIPSSVNLIKKGAFMDCSQLTHLTIEDGEMPIQISWMGYQYRNDENGNPLGAGMFSDCPLTHIYIGRNIDYDLSQSPAFTPNKAPFNSIRTLQNLEFGPNVNTIIYCLFADCYGLKELTIPKEIQTIGYAAFENGSSATINPLKKIIFEESTSPVELIGGNTSFAWLPVTIEELEINRNISTPAEALNSNITPWGWTYSFPKEIGLKSVKFGNAVTAIYPNFFYGCTNLETVEFGEGMAEIYQKAFYGCTNVKTIMSYANTPPQCWNDAVTPMCNGISTLYVPSESVERYRNNSVWGIFNIEPLPESGVSEIGLDADIIVDKNNHMIVISKNNSEPIYMFDSNGICHGCYIDGVIPLNSGLWILRQSHKSLKIIM